MKTDNKPTHTNRISSNRNELISDAKFDVIVIGSGYGGSIAASRMARAGQKVCLLERGLEKRPGQYPNTLSKMASELHVQGEGSSTNNPLGMFDFRLFDDVSVLLGRGLGGTSLINANVALEYHDFDHNWPKPFQDNPHLLDSYYQTAKNYLGTNTYPQHFPRLNKVEALKKSAKALHLKAEMAPVNVNFKASAKNDFGVQQNTCNLCGDCCSGCNYSAKNTTLMNYLPDAVNHGAKIYCGVNVNNFSQNKKQSNLPWQVHCEVITSETDSSAPKRSVQLQCKILIVSAGTLGSTEIMLRSQEAQNQDSDNQRLHFSDKLGEKFSGNGDVLAFGYNNYWAKDNQDKQKPINGVGAGERELDETELPGPCITGVIKIKGENNQHKKDLVVEEGVIPGALGSMLPAAFFFNAALEANFSRYGPEQTESRLNDIKDIADTVQNNPSDLNDLSYKGAVNRTQSYLVMSEDGADGKLQLDHNNKVKINWPNAGANEFIERDNRILQKLNDAAGGQFIANPLWDKAFGKKLITVHPLGGCSMGDDIHSGVVNQYGQVFSGETDNTLYQGLYICDGSILPHSIRVNPLLTISALTERCCEHICREHAWDYNTDVNSSSTNKHKANDHPETQENYTKQPDAAEPGELPRKGFIEKLKEAIIGCLGQVLFWFFGLLAKCFPKYFTCAVSFSETMSGFIQINQANSETQQQDKNKGLADIYQLAFDIGKKQGNALTLNLATDTPDLQAFIHNKQHSAGVKGELLCPSLFPGAESSNIIEVAGHVHLLEVDASTSNTWLMSYRLDFTHNNKAYRLTGDKRLHWTLSSNWWTDLTTLPLSIHAINQDSGQNRNNRPLALGIVKLKLKSLVKQAQSVSIDYNKPYIQRLTQYPFIKSIFNKIFAIKAAELFGTIVFRAYGRLLSSLSYADWEEFKHSHWPLRPLTLRHKEEIHWVTTKDNFTIKLTRYANNPEQGTNSLPVILAPGMGVNASSFANDAVDKNIVEFLNYDHNVDVWLLDYRSCYDSTSSKREFTIDDIARYDWPAAIAEVLAITQQQQVQAIVHCVGSMSLLMSLIRGYTDKNTIASLVSSQLTLHPISNWLNVAKSDLDIVDVLDDHLPEKGIVPLEIVDSEEQKTIDAIAYSVPVPPGEECNSAICKRIFAIYGPSYLHAQLNHKTHLKLHAWFQDIAVKPFEQMTKMISYRRTVDAEGMNTYLNESKASNLALPIDFVAGQLNLEFLPETSQHTLNWLNTHVPGAVEKQYYSRHVFKDYGHMDFFIGKNADRDIFPYLYQCLQKYDKNKH